jgi:outer membrane murein-binding lipoprotein Lpp
MDEPGSRIAKLEAQVDAIKDDVAELKTDVRDLHSRITTGNREIMDKLDSKFDSLNKTETAAHNEVYQSMERLSTRVDTLEKWRYMIVGAAIVLGYLVGNIDIAKFFK